jgi:hypothetical protein
MKSATRNDELQAVGFQFIVAALRVHRFFSPANAGGSDLL